MFPTRYGNVNRISKALPRTEKSTSDHHDHSDRSSTNSPIRSIHSRSSNGASSGSDSSEDILIDPLENDPWLTVANAKHRVMVYLMKDVYALFNSSWSMGFRSQTGSQSASPDAYSQNASSPKQSSTETGKRKAQDRDSHPPDGNEEKRRENLSLKSGDDHQKRFYACCFHKYNAQKYCSNNDTGTRYRSCAGPGFSKISQLK